MSWIQVSDMQRVSVPQAIRKQTLPGVVDHHRAVYDFIVAVVTIDRQREIFARHVAECGECIFDKLKPTDFKTGHFFNSRVQSVTMVIGKALDSFAMVLIRNRWPSRETAYCCWSMIWSPPRIGA